MNAVFHALKRRQMKIKITALPTEVNDIQQHVNERLKQNNSNNSKIQF